MSPPGRELCLSLLISSVCKLPLMAAHEEGSRGSMGTFQEENSAQDKGQPHDTKIPVWPGPYTMSPTDSETPSRAQKPPGEISATSHFRPCPCPVSKLPAGKAQPRSDGSPHAPPLCQAQLESDPVQEESVSGFHPERALGEGVLSCLPSDSNPFRVCAVRQTWV